MNRHRRLYIIFVAALLFVTSMGCHGRLFARHSQTPMDRNAQGADRARLPDTSNWKVYRNEKDGFQLKYPETWKVSSSRGTPPEMISFRGPYRGVIGEALTVAVQINMNPRKLGIEGWFTDQLRALDTSKLESKGCSTIARQATCFYETTDKFGKKRCVYTLLHQTDVLTFIYKLGTEDSTTSATIVDSLQLLN